MKRPTKADTSAADFNALYEARFVDLAGQLYAFTGDNCETYDLVQEAFIRAWQRWATVGRYEDPVAWVRRVAGNLAMSRHRRRQRSQSVLRGGNHVVPGLEPDRVALVQALRTLPEQHRRAVVLHYLADLSVTEIAAETGPRSARSSDGCTAAASSLRRRSIRARPDPSDRLAQRVHPWARFLR